MGQDTEVELAAMKEQLKAIQQSVDDVKVAVTKLIVIDRTVAELSVRIETHQDRIVACENKLVTITNLQEENTAYLNKLRGGFGLAVVIFSLVQAILLGGVSWVVTNVMSSREELVSVRQSVRHLDNEQDRLMSIMSGEIIKQRKDERK